MPIIMTSLLTTSIDECGRRWYKQRMIFRSFSAESSLTIVDGWTTFMVSSNIVILCAASANSKNIAFLRLTLVPRIARTALLYTQNWTSTGLFRSDGHWRTGQWPTYMCSVGTKALYRISLITIWL